MRVIVNIHSDSTAKISGWRVKAIPINEKSEVVLEEVLKAVILKDKLSMYDLVVEENMISDKFKLFVNGIRMPDKYGLMTKVKDNVQIHLIDNS